jgi:isopentenyl diphosphate isomerase/L-lactate dehydrogenase-like FMN-dependent dehydrogenase
LDIIKSIKTNSNSPTQNPPTPLIRGAEIFTTQSSLSNYYGDIDISTSVVSRGLPTPVPGQHMGMGKKMLIKCEDIIKSKYPTVKKIAVISGVGARDYYRSRGYELQGEYMVKDIDTMSI